MIELVNVSKSVQANGTRKTLAHKISAHFPARRRVALLGRNGAGKSTLLKIIAGLLQPDSGQVYHRGTISWPIGFAGSFHPDLSGAQNTRFIARIYGCDTDDLVEFVEEFAELGAHLSEPVHTYSSGMRSRLAFGVSMGVRFDTYLIDEVTSVGDATFQKRSRDMLLARTRNAGAIVVSHSMGMIRQLCTAGAVLEGGHLSYFDDVEDAINFHEKNLA